MICGDVMAQDEWCRQLFKNEEIRQELANAIESRKWDEMAAFQRDSNKLLNAINLAEF